MNIPKDKKPAVAATQRAPQRPKSEVPVTQRAPAPKISSSSVATTQRMPSLANEQVTLRLPAPDAKPAAAKATKSPVIIADRFRVTGKPLGGGATGEAEVYPCEHTETGDIVALKLYRYYAEPKESILAQLINLNHPNVVSLKTYGIWQGRFYEVMEFCEGGSFADIMPMPAKELRNYVGEIVDGLEYCHQQGIIHRDLKPNNLFFRDKTRTQPVIGDFGISSLLELDAKQVRVTQSAANLTLDYAAPELLDNHQVSAQTDYYALGMTLLHILLGKSPFAGMNQTDILVAHLRGRVNMPPSVPQSFQKLIKGLTEINSAQRWGHAEVMEWLSDVKVLKDNDNSWLDIPIFSIDGAGREVPYPNYPEAKSPQQLALVLDRFDAARDLFRGQIREWVVENFDRVMADKIEVIEDNYKRTPTVALVKLRYILYPQAPLLIGTQKVKSLPDLVKLLTLGDEATQQALGEALWRKAIEYWIQSAEVIDKSRIDVLIERIRKLRTRFKFPEDQEIALFSLLYILDTRRPLMVSKGIFAKYPSQLGEILRNYPNLVETAFKQLIFSRHLEEWLRAVEFADWQQEIKFIENIRINHQSHPTIASYMVGWHYQPELPLPLGQKRIHSPKELIRLVDHDPASHAAAVKLLEHGILRCWLLEADHLKFANELDSLLLHLDASWASRLEEVLHLLDMNLAYPQLQIGPKELAFGEIELGSAQIATIKIWNVGRGYLYGKVSLNHNNMGINIDKFVIEGDSVIQVHINSAERKPGVSYGTSILLETNGGRFKIPITYTVTAETISPTTQQGSPRNKGSKIRAVWHILQDLPLTSFLFKRKFWLWMLLLLGIYSVGKSLGILRIVNDVFKLLLGH